MALSSVNSRVLQFAVGSLHAAPTEDEILADILLPLFDADAMGVIGEAVKLWEIVSEGAIRVVLFLASIGQTDLTLEEHLIRMLLNFLADPLEVEVRRQWYLLLRDGQ